MIQLVIPPGPSVRLLVTGGRTFYDWHLGYAWLDYIQRLRGISIVIHGGARGADTVADSWARLKGVPCRAYEAQRTLYGSRAGPIRNTQMLIEGKPDAVLAFPGGRGTLNMCQQARAVDAPVWEVT